jgi:hypothetical protein
MHMDEWSRKIEVTIEWMKGNCNQMYINDWIFKSGAVHMANSTDTIYCKLKWEGEFCTSVLVSKSYTCFLSYSTNVVHKVPRLDLISQLRWTLSDCEKRHSIWVFADSLSEVYGQTLYRLLYTFIYCRLKSAKESNRFHKVILLVHGLGCRFTLLRPSIRYPRRYSSCLKIFINFQIPPGRRQYCFQ